MLKAKTKQEVKQINKDLNERMDFLNDVMSDDNEVESEKRQESFREDTYRLEIRNEDGDYIFEIEGLKNLKLKDYQNKKWFIKSFTDFIEKRFYWEKENFPPQEIDGENVWKLDSLHEEDFDELQKSLDYINKSFYDFNFEAQLNEISETDEGGSKDVFFERYYVKILK